MGLKLSNLSQQAYVTKTGIPMFVLGMFKSLQYFKCEVSHSFPLNAPIGTLQPHPFDVFDSSACTLTKQPPLPEWIEFLFTIPSTTISMSLLWLLTYCNIMAQIFSVTLFILILPLFTFCSSTLWFFLCASSVPISFLSLAG